MQGEHPDWRKIDEEISENLTEYRAAVARELCRNAPGTTREIARELDSPFSSARCCLRFYHEEGVTDVAERPNGKIGRNPKEYSLKDDFTTQERYSWIKALG